MLPRASFVRFSMKKKSRKNIRIIRLTISVLLVIFFSLFLICLRKNKTSDSNINRRPISILKTDKDDTYFITEDGVYIRMKEGDGGHSLPEIICGKCQPRNGDKTDNLVAFSAKLINVALLKSIDIGVVEIISENFVKFLSSGITEVFINPQKSLSESLDSLQLISNRSRIDGRKLSKIDLRFDKPVILE